MKLVAIVTRLLLLCPTSILAAVPEIVSPSQPATTQPSIMDVFGEAASYAPLFSESTLEKLPLNPQQAQAINNAIDSLVDRQSDLRMKQDLFMLSGERLACPKNTSGMYKQFCYSKISFWRKIKTL